MIQFAGDLKLMVIVPLGMSKRYAGCESHGFPVACNRIAPSAEVRSFVSEHPPNCPPARTRYSISYWDRLIIAIGPFEPVGYLSIGGILGEKLYAISKNTYSEAVSACDPSIGVVGVAGSNPVAPIH